MPDNKKLPFIIHEEKTVKTFYEEENKQPTNTVYNIYRTYVSPFEKNIQGGNIIQEKETHVLG